MVFFILKKIDGKNMSKSMQMKETKLLLDHTDQIV